MASWKERGMVPDSDEEDEGESQYLTNEGQRDYALQLGIADGGGNQSNYHLKSQDTFRQAARQGPSASGYPINDDAHSPFLQTVPVSDLLSPSPPVFKISLPLPGSQELPILRQVLSDGFPEADEEISRTYVALSSPLSSLNSSPSRNTSPQNKEVQWHEGIEAFNNEGDPFARGSNDGLETMEDVQRIGNGSYFSSTGKRILRDRNPIQLHPYALEGEKYRRALIARGMSPVRLPRAEHDVARKQPLLDMSPDPDFELGGSIIPNLGDEAITSQSPSQKSVHGHRGRTSEASGSPPRTLMVSDDDEFPDVNKLLTFRHEIRSDARSSVKKYTGRSRYTSRISSQLRRPRLFQNRNLANIRLEDPNIPPSPPASSSPLPAFSPLSPGLRALHIASSKIGSNSVISMEDIVSEDERRIGSLPTPKTNSVNHTVDLTGDDVDEEDHQVLDKYIVTSSVPVDDQSVQVRDVGRIVRGVLPASWLRLDRRTQHTKEPKTLRRENHSLSPVKARARRGIAIRKGTNNGSPTKTQNREGGFLELDSGEDDDETELLSILDESLIGQESDFTASQMDAESVMENDRVDNMFPPPKRQTKLVPGTRERKGRLISTSLFQRRASGLGIQPKITRHLTTPRNITSYSNEAKLRRIETTISSDAKKISKSIYVRKERKPKVPELSILDAVSTFNTPGASLPRFLRIAARNAKSKKALGRHSPTRKYIRLANREDTFDAQSTLRQWREGTIHPRADTKFQYPVPGRVPLVEVSGNTQINSPLARRKSSAMGPGLSIFPDVVTKPFISTPQNPSLPYTAGRRFMVKTRGRTNPRKDGQGNMVPIPVTRPAQLEMSLSEYSHRHPTVAFGSTKKTLDTLYRRTHKGSTVRGDVQLARFLGQDSVGHVGDVVSSIGSIKDGETLSAANDGLSRKVRRRKKVPMRLDANAAVFRQPNEPLTLELFQPKHENQSEFSNDRKLSGLGAYGTAYSYHFDVFALPAEVFFHESTSVGRGRLKDALDIFSKVKLNQGHILHQLADKSLRWGPWNAEVSSQLGLCMDLIMEQLDEKKEKVSEVDANDIFEHLLFVIDYVQKFLSFPDQSDRKACLLRFVELLRGFVERLAKLASSKNIDNNTMNLQLIVDLSSHTMILTYQLLRICRIDSPEFQLAIQFEQVLQKVATTTVSLLFSVGLDAVHTLYDDLQYLAFREAGIKDDRYAAQAWVIMMHILQVAKVPGASFWEVVNSRLIITYEIDTNDAKVLERIWYWIFSLQPLIDIDSTGVNVPDLRTSRSMENWALLQRLLKKIFDIYDSKSRQSPGFNDYCRTLLNRCSHLMQNWGWGRHGSIVGTIFDFFARHKLAHLRNEEVYQSPRFLTELDREPSLAVDPDDRCFHILLKVIAVAIKQMVVVEDTKGIRNIVTRVLPNHDRQYPKEEAVRQRDLASLRNHHDLLCTLFWAAPAALRPSLTLIRQLVNPASSHAEAYLINLRAWQNLTRFVLASTPTPAAYSPLDTWQFDCFWQLLEQYMSAERDIEDQLRTLSVSDKQLISQHTITKTLEKNRHQIMAMLLQQLRVYERTLKEAPSINAARVVFFGESFINTLTHSLNLFVQCSVTEMPIAGAALDVISAYATRLNRDMPAESHLNHGNSQEDSQDYGSDVFSEVDCGRWEYTGELNSKLLKAVREVVRTSLRAAVPIEIVYMEKILETWALIAGTLIMSKIHTLSDYISDTGVYNELRIDDKARNVRCSAVFFWSRLAQITKDHFNLKEADRDLLSDWLCLLVKPAVDLSSENILLPLFAKSDPILEHIAIICSRQFGIDQFNWTLDTIELYRLMIIEGEQVKFQLDSEELALISLAILQEMEKQLPKHPDNKTRFQCILRRIMDTMKRDLVDMDPNSSEANLHQDFIGGVLVHITTFFHDLCPVDEFFMMSSVYPSHNEPQMFMATLRNYALRLHTDRGKSELNHYCFGFAKQAAVEGRLEDMADMLFRAIDSNPQQWTDLAQHLLTVLVPSFTHSAFVSDFGWILAEPFLTAADYQLRTLVYFDKTTALNGTRTIMSTIVNGIWLLALMHPMSNFSQVKHSLIYVLFLTIRFVNSTLAWLPGTLGDSPAVEEEIMGYLNLINQFATLARDYIVSPMRAFVKVLRGKLQSASDSRNTEQLLKAYEAFGTNHATGTQRIAQEAALKNLAKHCASSPDDVPDIMDELKLHQTQRVYNRGSCIFKGLQEAADTHSGNHWLRPVPCAEAPEFSSVVLSDIQKNWGQPDGTLDVEIKFGRTCHATKGLWHSVRDVDELYTKLLRELQFFVHEYPRIAMPVKEVLKRDRRIFFPDGDLMF